MNNGYSYTTTFNNPVFKVPMRKKPNVNSEKIMDCDMNSIIRVIERTNNQYYFVEINGKFGYVSKAHLKEK